jgi:large subunit ribosomal protein L40
MAGGGFLNPKNRGKHVVKTDSRITLIRYHMQHPKTPRPLRFSRMRALRHWTIHRAWMLFRRNRMAEEELELQR